MDWYTRNIKIRKEGLRLLTEYEKFGKEFGLTHKKDYLVVLILYSIVLVIISYSVTPIIAILFYVLALSPETIDIANVLLYMFFLLEFLLYLGITVPLSNFGLDLIANTEKSFEARYASSFNVFKLRSILGSLTTNIIIALPSLLYSFITTKFFGDLVVLGTLSFNFDSTSNLIEFILWVLGIFITFCVTLKLIIDYFLVPFLLALDPETKGNTVRKESKKLMLNHEKEASFLAIRLILLGVISSILVIPLIWFIPYAYATLTYYALDLLAEGDYVSYAEDEEEVVNELDSLLQ